MPLSIKENVVLRDFTTFKMGGFAAYFADITKEEEVPELEGSKELIAEFDPDEVAERGVTTSGTQVRANGAQLDQLGRLLGDGTVGAGLVAHEGVAIVSATGSTAIMRTDGLRALMTSPTPVIVPPVPMPATKWVTLPSVSAQISGPVVSKWMRGLAGFSNCWGIQYFLGSLATISRARAMAPGMPFAPSVSTSSAPKARRIILRSGLAFSGRHSFTL